MEVIRDVKCTLQIECMDLRGRNMDTGGVGGSIEEASWN